MFPRGDLPRGYGAFGVLAGATDDVGGAVAAPFHAGG